MSDVSDVPAAARQIIERFDLAPHPEGGWYRQTFSDVAPDGTVRSTAIYFLLAQGERSHWHRVHHASEVWHHYAGDPIHLRMSDDGATTQHHVLGADLSGSGVAGVGVTSAGVSPMSNQPGTMVPQVVVPAGVWQSAESSGEWTLVGCTVAPGFDFDHFELAPPDWEPGT